MWNRNPAKCEPLAGEGATVADSPAAVARAATYTFAMLSDPEAAMQVGNAWQKKDRMKERHKEKEGLVIVSRRVLLWRAY